MFPDVTVITQM